jgi:hypothetical protein
LELACWYTAAEANLIAATSYLGELEVLVVWLGGYEWKGAIPESDLVRLFAGSRAWPKLRSLILFDPGGGERTDLARIANEIAGRQIASVIPAPDGRLPFAPEFSYFCPGKLPDGRRMVAKPIEELIHVIVFGDDSNVTQEYSIPQTEEVRGFVAEERYLYGASQEFRDAIHGAVGSTPAFIRVFPFRWPDEEDNPVDCSEYHHRRWSVYGSPDRPDRTPEDPLGNGGEISWLVEEGQFGCGVGWCDKTGKVHST